MVQKSRPDHNETVLSPAVAYPAPACRWLRDGYILEQFQIRATNCHKSGHIVLPEKSFLPKRPFLTLPDAVSGIGLQFDCIFRETGRGRGRKPEADGRKTEAESGRPGRRQFAPHGQSAPYLSERWFKRKILAKRLCGKIGHKYVKKILTKTKFGVYWRCQIKSM